MKIKVMKIDGTNGCFIDPIKLDSAKDINCQYKDIKDITSDNIINIISYLITNKDSVELDPYDDKKLPNPAQNIIYKHLYTNFEELIKNRDQIIKEIDETFKECEQKYLKHN